MAKINGNSGIIKKIRITRTDKLLIMMILLQAGLLVVEILKK